MPASAPAPIQANGVELCVQAFGDPAAPAILLIAGAASSMDYWDEALCERLAAGRRRVVRYDLRDTGQSVAYPAGSPGYTFDDLVDDAAGIIDAFGAAPAHVVGLSMGGAIAQCLALDHPAHVASLVLVSTSSATSEPRERALPPPSDELEAAFEHPRPAPDWFDRGAVIEHAVEDWRLYAGPNGLDEDRLRELAGRIYDRTRNVEASVRNHWLLSDGSEPRPRRLADIVVPTLVVHGTDDPLFPYQHAEALAEEIPGAQLLPLAGVGHEYPPPETWDELVPAILDVTERAVRG